MTAATTPSAAPERTPTVLAFLVVRDAELWLRDVLKALADQTYPRLGVIAIDDASTDGSYELLAGALGPQRVIRHEERIGLSRSFDEALELPVAAEAGFLLLLHDDAALDPEAVVRLVEATQIPGIDRVGIVGAKIVDWEQPRRLLDVGRSSDRFGHPYSSLQADELDQGQFDRVLEVLSVDSCAMLVARETWQQIGLFDERLGDDDGDLDLCWRARVAGWRVLMTPQARVRHRIAGERDDRPDVVRSRRFEEDRAALAGVLKNDGLLTLLWVVPLGLLLTVVRGLYLVVARRFEEAFEVSAAVGWNLAHLPGTLRRRWRVQKARGVRDRSLRRFTASAGLRLPRWFQSAEQIFEEQRELSEADADVPAARRFRHRTVSLSVAHPVIVASAFGLLVGALAIRHLLGPDPLTGGALPTFPPSPSGFFTELVAAYRSTGLGGTLPASPALAALGGLSYLSFGSTDIAQRVMLAGLPALGAVLAYRACVRLTARPGASVVAAVAYALSAPMLWAFSEGRLGFLVALAVLPALVERLESSFRGVAPQEGRLRFSVGVGVTLAVGTAFEPAVLLAFALVLAVELVGGGSRGRGAARAVSALIGAAILLFPFVPTLVAGGGAVLGSEVGTTDTGALARLALGPAPGAWVFALFLPLGAVLGLALSTEDRRAGAVRLGCLSVAGLALAWLSAAGYLPAALSNAPIYTGLAAVCQALLLAYGVASTVGALSLESFGARQVGAGLLALSVGGGVSLQTIAVATGEWGVAGPERVPAAWAVVDSAAKGRFRVLWVGADDGRSFPPPGGDPDGVVEAGAATLRYALTERDGDVAIDIARPLTGPGADALESAIASVLSGATSHGGALLAPYGVRYVVASEEGLPPDALERLLSQADLDLVPATGLLILRNAVGLPPAAVVQARGPELHVIASAEPGTLQLLRSIPVTRLPSADGGWAGPGDGNVAVISTEFDPAWEMDGSTASPERAFGWATSFPIETGAPVHVRYGAQLPATLSAWLLAAVWAAALWFTRKPVRR